MNVVIADDEPFARERLRDLLAGHADVTVVAEAGDGDAVLRACARWHPDLLLLDVAMPGPDGMEVARRLTAATGAPRVVFCTAYDQYALPAFETAAVDYLMKPVRAERLAMALDRVRAGLQMAAAAETPPVVPGRAPRRQLCVRRRGSLRLIPVEDIRYLQADEKYVVIHHAKGEDLLEESLRSLEDEFGERFVRIHRNCLIARAQLAELQRGGDGQLLVRLLDGNRLLEVSRRCAAQVRDLVRQA